MDHTKLFLSKGYGPDSGNDYFLLELLTPGPITSSEVKGYCITGCV
jgi:hypothetical protein